MISQDPGPQGPGHHLRLNCGKIKAKSYIIPIVFFLKMFIYSSMTIKQKKEKLIQYMKKDKDLKPYAKDIQELNNKSFSVFLKIAKSLKP